MQLMLALNKVLLDFKICLKRQFKTIMKLVRWCDFNLEIVNKLIRTIFSCKIQCRHCTCRRSDSQSSSCYRSCKRMECNSSNWNHSVSLEIESHLFIWTWPYHIAHKIAANMWVRKVFSCLIVVVLSWWQFGHGWSFTGNNPTLDWFRRTFVTKKSLFTLNFNSNRF